MSLPIRPGSGFWGVYYQDREYAREMGDPLRTVVRARGKVEAERIASRLGFSDPWVQPVAREEARRFWQQAVRIRRQVHLRPGTHPRGIGV